MGQKEQYEINGQKYAIHDIEWVMRTPEGIPVVRLHPQTFIPSGRKGWGGVKYGKSVKRVQHLFEVGSETALCGKTQIIDNDSDHFSQTMSDTEYEGRRTVIFGVDDLAWPLEVDPVMRCPQLNVCKTCLKTLSKFEGNEITTQKWREACGVE